MNSCHQRSVIFKRLWQWYSKVLKLLLSICKIELIEHAVTPVLGQCRPILLPELTTLCKKPVEICFLSKFITILRFVDMITTDFIVTLPHWHHVDTFAWFKINLPIIFRHTCYHMVVGEMPLFSNMAIFYPDVTILFCKWNLCNCILYKDRRMRLTIQVHYLTLIVYQIL